MPREKETGPACATNLVGDGFDFDSSSSSEDDNNGNVSNVRVSGRRAESSDDESSSRKAPARRVQGRSANEGRSIRMHSLSGTTRVSAAAAAEAVAPSDSDWKQVRISFRLATTLRQLANGESKAELKLSDKAMAIFDDSPDKRSENHICGGMSVVEYDNTFPATLHLDVMGVKADTPVKSFTSTGSSGALTFRPKSSFSGENGLKIAAGNVEMAEQSAFLRDYKGWNLNNVEKGITYAANGEQAFVEAGHPVVSYFNAVLEEDGEEPLTERDLIEGTNMFMTSAEDTRVCLASLKRTMQQRLQIQNLYNVSFGLRRAHGELDDEGNVAWDDEEEIFDGLQGRHTGDAILDAKRTFCATIAYKFRTLD